MPHEQVYSSSQLVPGNRVVVQRWVREQHGHRYWLTPEAHTIVAFITWLWDRRPSRFLPRRTWFLNFTWQLCSQLEAQTDLVPSDLDVDVLKALWVADVIEVADVFAATEDPGPPLSLRELWLLIYEEIARASG